VDRPKGGQGPTKGWPRADQAVAGTFVGGGGTFPRKVLCICKPSMQNTIQYVSLIKVCSKQKERVPFTYIVSYGLHNSDWANGEAWRTIGTAKSHGLYTLRKPLLKSLTMVTERLLSCIKVRNIPSEQQVPYLFDGNASLADDAER